MANNIIKRAWNQNRMVNIEALSGMAFQAEAGGHTFVISGTDDTGAVVPLTGTVAGVFRRADNADIALTGSASEGVVSVTLTDDCYAVPGRFGLTIFVTSGSQTTAVYAAVGTVSVTSGGGVAGETPQDVVDLINAIAAAVATIPADYTDLMEAIAPTYSPSGLYPVGFYVWHDGDLYRCIAPTSGAWDASCWVAAPLGPYVANLKSALNEVANDFGAISPYKAHSDCYIDSSGTIIPAVGYSIYEIPVEYGDIVLVSDSGTSKFYGSITLGNVFNFKNIDDTYTHLGSGYATNFIIRSDQDKYMLIIPAGVKRLAVSAYDNYYQNVAFQKNFATPNFNGVLLKKDEVISPIDSSWIISSVFYPRQSDDTFRALTSNVFAFSVKSGDNVKFETLVSPFTYYGTFKDKSTLDVVNITSADFVVPSDGYVFAFGDDTSGIVYSPYNGIQISKRNVIGLNKIISGKIYCAFGDSITAGNNLLDTEVNWPNIVASEFGATLINCGVGSSRVAGNQSTAFHKEARLDAVKAGNPDIVTIMGGANDLVAGYAIGDETQFDLPLADKNTMTYLGAYSYVVESLLAWKPSLQIVILGMYYAYADGTEYSETLTYQMISDASEKLAKHYCLPFVDLHHDTGFNQFTMGASPNNLYTRDRIHPNQLGCNKIASIVIDKFMEVFSK